MRHCHVFSNIFSNRLEGSYAVSNYFKHPLTVKNPIGSTKSAFEERGEIFQGRVLSPWTLYYSKSGIF